MALQRKRNAPSFPTFRGKEFDRHGVIGVPAGVAGKIGGGGAGAPSLSPPHKGAGKAAGLTRTAAGASAIPPLRTARYPSRPAPRSCERHAGPWCGRVRRSGGRFPAAIAGGGG